jgi:hypothetical protein
MIKMGVLACLLGGKGKVSNRVFGLLSGVGLGSYGDVGVYRKRRGGGNR